MGKKTRELQMICNCKNNPLIMCRIGQAPGRAVVMQDHATEAMEAEPGRGLAEPQRWHLCHLPFGAQMLIWAMRMWVNDEVPAAERWATIRQAFAKIGAADATVPFLRLLETIQAGARGPVLIGEGGCGVFPDEIRLVGAMVEAIDARGEVRPAPATARLDRLLAPGARRIARRHLEDLGRELGVAGLRFPRAIALSAPVARPASQALH
ncbi:MAG: hypothetical protein R3F55_13265 [Alphaproteobacteria bacterium]